ncbi:MAG: hypothetical protein ACXVCP_06920 [Bdellovibrio sp.]
MKTRTLNIKGIFFGVVLSCMTAPAMAAETASLEKIAECTVPADANNSAESITLSFIGGDRNSADQYTVHFKTATVDDDFNVQAIEWQNNGSTLAIRFAKFLVAEIHSGQSSDSTIGVALGRAPRAMTCDANF